MLRLGVPLGALHIQPLEYEASHACDRESKPHTCELLTDVRPAVARWKLCTCERGSASCVYRIHAGAAPFRLARPLLHSPRSTLMMQVETVLADGIAPRCQ